MHNHEIARRYEPDRPPPKRDLALPVPVLISLACLAVVWFSIAAYGAWIATDPVLPRWLTVGSCLAAAGVQTFIVVRTLIDRRAGSR